MTRSIHLNNFLGESRADGFEEYIVALEYLATQDHVTPEQASWFRFFQRTSIALIETCNEMQLGKKAPEHSTDPMIIAANAAGAALAFLWHGMAKKDSVFAGGRLVREEANDGFISFLRRLENSVHPGT